MSCELCEDKDATIKCAACEDSGVGGQFCEECSTQLHSAAKTKSHGLTDMQGNPLSSAPAAPPTAITVTAPSASNQATHSGPSMQECSLCEDKPSTTNCVQCDADYCQDCCTDFHKPAKQAGHTLRKLVLAGSEKPPSAAAAAAPVAIPKSPAPASHARSMSTINVLKPAVQPLTPLTAGVSGKPNALASIAKPGHAPRLSLSIFGTKPGGAVASPTIQPLSAQGLTMRSTGTGLLNLKLPGSATPSPSSARVTMPPLSGPSQNLLPSASLFKLSSSPPLTPAPALSSSTDTKCSVCEDEESVVKCPECEDQFCKECDVDVHSSASKMRHVRVKFEATKPTASPPLSASAPTSAAKRPSINPLLSGMVSTPLSPHPPKTILESIAEPDGSPPPSHRPSFSIDSKLPTASPTADSFSSSSNNPPSVRNLKRPAAISTASMPPDDSLIMTNSAPPDATVPASPMSSKVISSQPQPPSPPSHEFLQNNSIRITDSPPTASSSSINIPASIPELVEPEPSPPTHYEMEQRRRAQQQLAEAEERRRNQAAEEAERERLRALDAEREKERQREREREQEREREKQREKELEQERTREREKERERERDRERERERERQREHEPEKRDLEREKELEKERVRQAELDAQRTKEREQQQSTQQDYPSLSSPSSFQTPTHDQSSNRKNEPTHSPSPTPIPLTLSSPTPLPTASSTHSVSSAGSSTIPTAWGSSNPSRGPSGGSSLESRSYDGIRGRTEDDDEDSLSFSMDDKDFQVNSDIPSYALASMMHGMSRRASRNVKPPSEHRDSSRSPARRASRMDTDDDEHRHRRHRSKHSRAPTSRSVSRSPARYNDDGRHQGPSIRGRGSRYEDSHETHIRSKSRSRNGTNSRSTISPRHRQHRSHDYDQADDSSHSYDDRNHHHSHNRSTRSKSRSKYDDHHHNGAHRSKSRQRASELMEQLLESLHAARMDPDADPDHTNTQLLHIAQLATSAALENHSSPKSRTGRSSSRSRDYVSPPSKHTSSSARRAQRDAKQAFHSPHQHQNLSASWDEFPMRGSREDEEWLKRKLYERSLSRQMVHTNHSAINALPLSPQPPSPFPSTLSHAHRASPSAPPSISMFTSPVRPPSVQSEHLTPIPPPSFAAASFAALTPPSSHPHAHAFHTPSPHHSSYVARSPHPPPALISPHALPLSPQPPLMPTSPSSPLTVQQTHALAVAAASAAYHHVARSYRSPTTLTANPAYSQTMPLSPRVMPHPLSPPHSLHPAATTAPITAFHHPSPPPPMPPQPHAAFLQQLYSRGQAGGM